MYELYEFSGKLSFKTMDKEQAVKCFEDWPHIKRLIERWEYMEVVRERQPDEESKQEAPDSECQGKGIQGGSTPPDWEVREVRKGKADPP